jgi:hypothetical protein
VMISGRSSEFDGVPRTLCQHMYAKRQRTTKS